MLAELASENFRNLQPLSWRPTPGANLLLGPNGAGKTSLLEAVYLVATTRSFRTAQIADCCSHGTSSFAVTAEVEAERRSRLTVEWRQGAGLTRSTNGRSGSVAEHLGICPIVAWSAADAAVVAGAADARRRLLDQGVVALRPRAVEAIARYRQALEHKRELLARRAPLGASADLGAWNEVLARAAAELVELRAAYSERLAAALAVAAGTAGLGLGDVELRYRPSLPAAATGAEAALAVLERLRRVELQRGLPLAGPHRDELEIRVGGHEVRRAASAGERKALGLLLAAARRDVLTAAGRAPILLLDDADVELDPGRLRLLWPVLASGEQTLLSSSRTEVWSGLEPLHRWPFEGGRPGQLAVSGATI